MDDIEQRLRNRSVTRWIPSPDETPETKYYDVDAERAEAADTILALRAQVLALEKDAARYRWLAPRLLAADFAWGVPAVTVLVFEWPSSVAIGGDCSKNIDAAIQSQEQP